VTLLADLEQFVRDHRQHGGMTGDATEPASNGYRLTVACTLLGLTWERVDVSRGVIRLELTKSGRRREVPMNDDSYRALVSLGPKASGRVFKTRYMQTAYNNAVAAAELDDVNFHTLRHTFASWAVMRGVTIKELQDSQSTSVSAQASGQEPIVIVGALQNSL